MSRLKYADIMNLPSDHPDYLRFMDELGVDNYTEADYNGSSIFNDEDSLDYFNRYIAGDR